MTDTTNLSMLIELARSGRDAAAARHAQLVARVEQARAQAEMLCGYARDYQARSQGQLAQGMDVAASSNFRAFVDKLSQAIGQHDDELARLRTLAIASEDEAMQMERKLKSLEMLLSRQQAKLFEVASRREQRSTDEMALQVTLRRASSAG